MHPQQSRPGARGLFAPIAAAAVLSHMSRPRRLVATQETRNGARLRDSDDTVPPQHRQVCSGTRATGSEGESKPRALRRTHMLWARCGDIRICRTKAGARGSSALTMRAFGTTAAIIISTTSCSSNHRSSAGASAALHFLDLQAERDQQSRIRLHGGLGNRKLQATMEPDLSGRTVSGLHSRHRE